MLVAIVLAFTAVGSTSIVFMFLRHSGSIDVMFVDLFCLTYVARLYLVFSDCFLD
jgi:hypothetical protein